MSAEVDRKRRFSWPKEYARLGLEVGMALVLFSVLFELVDDVIEIRTAHPYLDFTIGKLLELFELLFAHLGVALIVFGLVGWALETEHFSTYFLEKLAKTVVARDYLSRLGEGELKAVQKDVVRAYYGQKHIDLRDVDLETGYYRQFQKLFDDIGKPYRENTTDHMSVRFLEQSGEEDRGYFVITDELSYTCRRVGGTIPPDVKWIPDTDEIIESLEVTVRIPLDVFESEAFAKEHGRLARDEKKRREWRFSLDNEPSAFTAEGPGYRFELDTISEEIKTIDELFIEVKVRYRSRAERGLPWTMSLPSKKVNVVIHYPHELRIHVQNYGVREEALEPPPTDEDGLYSFTYPSWLQPDTGFHFLFLKKERAQEQTTVRPPARDVAI